MSYKPNDIVKITRGCFKGAKAIVLSTTDYFHPGNMLVRIIGKRYLPDQAESLPICNFTSLCQEM